MKILQINATYGIGSTGTITKEISELCLQNGIQAYAAFSAGFGININKESSYEIGTQLDHKIHALLCRIAGKQGYFSRFATIRFLKYIDTIKPDIVHLHNLHSNYINLNLLLRYLAKNNIITVITLHDCWYFTGGCFHYTAVRCEKWKSHCYNCIKQKEDTPALILDRSSNILSDRILYLNAIPNLTFVGVSKWITGQLYQSKLSEAGNITCIYNGFNLNEFKRVKTNKKSEIGLEGKFIILGPASKWLSTINRSTLQYFIKNIPTDAVLLLFGYDGIDKKIAPNVYLYPYAASRQEMVELYSIANVMVNCSREDTLSSINIEAQACETPVVTYDATGSQETVNNISSYSVQTGDYKLLYEKVMSIYKGEKQILSQSSRDFVSENFEKITNYNKYIELYKTLINERDTE